MSVRSYGVTIQAAERERVFERFYRSRAGEDAPPGTGLGLSIVKRIAECHRGSVWVESDEATGTVFCFALPLAQAYLLRDDLRQPPPCWSKRAPGPCSDWSASYSSQSAGPTLHRAASRVRNNVPASTADQMGFL